MKIVAIEHGLDLAQNFGAPRPGGVHMSDLYNDYYKKIQPKRYKGWSGTQRPVDLWEAGMVFEDMLEEGLTRRIIGAQEKQTGLLGEGSGRPEPMQTDEGIWFSPDLLIFNHVTRTGEIKLTFMSTKGAPWELGAVYTGFDAKFDKYFTQMKCYCKHLGTRYARLYAFFVRGDYKGPNPVLRAWDIEFTQHELDEEWDLMWRHAKSAGLLKGLR